MKALKYERDVNDISQFVSKCLLRAKSVLRILLGVVSMFETTFYHFRKHLIFCPENAPIEMILKLSSKLNVSFGAFLGIGEIERILGCSRATHDKENIGRMVKQIIGWLVRIGGGVKTNDLFLHQKKNIFLFAWKFNLSGSS